MNSSHRPIWFGLSLLLLATLACNAFAGTPEPLAPPPTLVTDGGGDAAPTVALDPDTVAPTVTLPGDTPPPSETAVSPPTGPAVTVLTDLNVRTGPGVVYDVVGFILQGNSAPVVGRDPNTGWWKIECPASVLVEAECWVSGGSQFSQAVNVEGVPVAQAPPTPTPEPEPVPEGQGVLVFVDNGRLFSTRLDLTQTIPTASEPLQLGEQSGISRLYLSPDGQKIAYLAGDARQPSLFVINNDGSGGQLLLNPTDVPKADPSSDTGLAFGQISWLPDSSGLAFTTDLINLVGPGILPQQDLWTVALDGNFRQRFIIDEGGGSFAISPNNRVIFGQPEAVIRANLDGSGREVLITFDFVNTASEYAYVPQIQWVAGGSRAYLAISSASPWEELAATAELWQINPSGAPQRLQTLQGNILFNPVVWSPDGQQLAFVQQLISANNPLPQMVVANADGSDPQPLGSEDGLQFHAWSPDSGRFLYSWNGAYAIGARGVEPQITAVPGQRIVAAQWLTSDQFLVAVGGDLGWTLTSANRNGDATPLLTINGNVPQFAVWTP